MSSNTERIVALEKALRLRVDHASEMSKRIEGETLLREKHQEKITKVTDNLRVAVKALEESDDIEELREKLGDLVEAFRQLPAPVTTGREKPLKQPSKALQNAMKATLKRNAAKAARLAAES